jgi:CHAT domain-containing protein/tetratricopeptide (TPR) repeat protein
MRCATHQLRIFLWLCLITLVVSLTALQALQLVVCTVLSQKLVAASCQELSLGCAENVLVRSQTVSPGKALESEARHQLTFSADVGPRQSNTPNLNSSDLVLVAARRSSSQHQVPSAKRERFAERNKQLVAHYGPTVSEDRNEAAAHGALSEAEQLRHEWTLESFRKAIEKYQQALLGWRAIGDSAQQAAALKNIGDIYELLSEHERALSSYARALLLFRQTRDRKAESRTLNAIGAVYVERGENHRALETCDHALKGSRSAGDPWGEAEALHCMGNVHWSFNDIPSALQLLNQALDLRRSVNDRRGEADTLLLLGYTDHARKEVGQARGLYEQSLRLWSEIGDLQGRAKTLLALGHLLNDQGERQEALSLYDECRSLFHRMGDRIGENSALHGIAFVYFAMGDKEKAIGCYQEALQMSKKLRDAEGEATALRYLGEIHRELGNYDESLQCSQQAIFIFRTMSSVLGESYATSDIGKAYEAQGKNEKALEFYSQALELCRKGGEPFHEGSLLNAIGHVYQLKGQHAMALDYYQRALVLQREVKDSVGEPGTLYNLARFEADRNSFNEARAHIEAALKIVESLRTKVASQDLRSSYFASVRQHYDLYVDLLMRMHQQGPSEGLDAAGFQATERARARSLLESLTEARADIRQGIDPTLLERERSLQQLLNAKADRQMRLGGKPDEKESVVLANEIRALTTEYEELQGQIRSKSPRYAALTQPHPLGLQEIRQQVLDDETLLLEYALGDERSYLWAVTRTAITSHELPKRAEIEKAARHVYELLVARQPKPGETARQHTLRVTQADDQYWQHAGLLSEILLGPVADQLGTKRLLVVAEGALQYLPFGALPVPEGQGERVKPKTAPFIPLILDHEIVNLPSASALAVLRREMPHRKSPTRAVAVLADPVFEPDDPRIARSAASSATTSLHPAKSFVLPPGGKDRTASKSRLSSTSAERTASLQPPAPASELHRALRDVGIMRDGSGIARLLSSRQEAEAIMAVTPAGAGLKAIDFKASRATALSPELGEYRIVHFATHGVLNSENPALSCIVLSLVDEQGRPQDGYLRLHDIYNLNLSADLVVLSACNTALGKDIKGEGLVGLVRGFMYAGAPRVVASLWKVDDEATAELMKHFYRQMFQENQTPAAALRAAQIALRQQKRWQSPYYWAAFTLQGEWK